MSFKTSPISTPSVPPPAPTPPPGGSWNHPRSAEIHQRKRAATFDDTKFWTAFYSVLLLTLSLVLPSYNPVTRIITPSSFISQFSLYTLRAIQLMILTNLLIALRPLLPFYPQDDISDIPLTPRQRQLFGLAPVSTPPTPGSTFSTPPRYTRSTPRAVSAGSSVAANIGSSPHTRSVGGTPLHGTPLRASIFGSPSGSLESTPNGSVAGLIRRSTVGGGASKKKERPRWSVGSSGGGLTGLEDSVFGTSTPNTPTPAGTESQRGASVVLNNKWLYKRQHGSPGQRYV